MSRSIHSIARHFLDKDSLDQCTIEEVRELAEKHPYASALQFLLLEKLRTADQASYNAQAQKSILYFHDPLAFQYLLDPGRFVTELPEINPEASVVKNIEEIPPTPVSEETLVAEPTEIISLPEEKPEETNSPLVEEYKAPEPAHYPEPEPGNNSGREEEKHKAIEEKAVEKENTGDDFPLNSQDEIIRDPVESNRQENAEPELTMKPISIPIADASGNELVFDPYHTVDYFASQGIKLSQDEFAKDKFGKQLKSFTEWLKSMKRLPANQGEVKVDSRTEDKVLHLAEDSIHQSEVYTEAMADVWLKQGNKAKAIEVYNKLSLLNPSKKAYFATQIENLKQS